MNIAPTRVDVAPGHTISTTAYNGSAPGPLIRLRQGSPVTVDIFNRTDHAEYVHWHGFEIPAKIDGAEEEHSLAVPAGSHLRYQMTPLQPGSRYVHSHSMAMDDLSQGTYSGQFAFVYVDPKRHPGRYDQEIFLATHEWEPYFIEGEDEETQGIEYLGETDWAPTSVEVAYRIRSINGKALGSGEPIRTKEGQRVLFHILNASATENIQLYLPGHEFVVVALDGNPVPRPRRVGLLELGAAERVDAFVDMKNPGVWILGSPDNDVRGSGLGILVEYAGKKGPATHAQPAGPAWDYRLFGKKPEAATPAETLPMLIDRVTPNGNGMERWTINSKNYNPSDEPRTLRKGTRYRLAFTNRTADAHPLHLHRNTFELTAAPGVRKDIVLVKGFQTVEIDVIPQQQGLTLFHCHQQMHMDHGFKTVFNVV
ncbi:MAG: multicopper oxidase domain-containing protein [Bryobacteraceae bacterium]